MVGLARAAWQEAKKSRLDSVEYRKSRKLAAKSAELKQRRLDQQKS